MQAIGRGENSTVIHLLLRLWGRGQAGFLNHTENSLGREAVERSKYRKVFAKRKKYYTPKKKKHSNF